MAWGRDPDSLASHQDSRRQSCSLLRKLPRPLALCLLLVATPPLSRALLLGRTLRHGDGRAADRMQLLRVLSVPRVLRRLHDLRGRA